jgi:hypothetical protein
MNTRLRLVLASIAALALHSAAHATHPFPETIALPAGFSPEGVAVGAGTTCYAGSIRDVCRADLRSGAGAVFVDAPPGRTALGLKADIAGHRLFVAGGPTGQAYVYDLDSGADLGAITLADAGAGPTFVNDVVVTGQGAWCTDSNRPVLHHVAFLDDGRLGAPEVLPLTGPAARWPGRSTSTASTPPPTAARSS